VHGLFGNTQAAGDVLPGPAEVAGVLDLEQFEAFGQCTKGGHGAQADVGVLASRAFGNLKCRFHVRQHMLTGPGSSTHADGRHVPGPTEIIPPWYGERLDLDYAIATCFANAEQERQAQCQDGTPENRDRVTIYEPEDWDQRIRRYHDEHPRAFYRVIEPIPV
jgi:hypothetical protein